MSSKMPLLVARIVSTSSSSSARWRRRLCGMSTKPVRSVSSRNGNRASRTWYDANAAIPAHLKHVGQELVHPGVARRDLHVAVEDTRLVGQQTVGERLPPAMVAGVPFRRTSSCGFGTSSAAVIRSVTGGANEREQCPVDLVRMRPGDVVRASLDRDELELVQQRRQPRGGRRVREDPVLGAVHDQHRDVDLRQVASKVGQPGVHARVRRERRATSGDGEARLPGGLADPLRLQLVDVGEVVEEVLEVRVAVPEDRRLDVLEHLPVDALGVVVRPQQERGERREERRLPHAAGAVRPEVPRHLAGPHREPDQDDAPEIQALEQVVQVGGEGVVVVADRGSAGTAEPSAVVGDHAEAPRQQHPFLALPRAPVQRVPVHQHDGFAAAVVLVVDLDRSTVLRPDCDPRHVTLPSELWCVH